MADSQEFFRQEPGACLPGGRGWLLWGWVCPFPLPPASYLQQGWAGSSLEFLSPFVLRTAGGVFGQVNYSPLLSHSLKKLPPTALRAFWPVPTLSNAARSSLFRPYLLVAGAGVWGTFLLGVAFRHVICGPYLIFPSSYVALRDLKTSPRPASVRVSWWLETSSIRLPSQDGTPSLALLSPFLSFIFCPTYLRRQWVAFLGAWCPLLAIKSFVKFVQRSIVLLMNL